MPSPVSLPARCCWSHTTCSRLPPRSLTFPPALQAADWRQDAGSQPLVPRAYVLPACPGRAAGGGGQGGQGGPMVGLRPESWQEHSLPGQGTSQGWAQQCRQGSLLLIFRFSCCCLLLIPPAYLPASMPGVHSGLRPVPAGPGAHRAAASVPGGQLALAGTQVRFVRLWQLQLGVKDCVPGPLVAHCLG